MEAAAEQKRTKNKVYEYYLKLCKKRGVDYQTIDFEAYYDSTLTAQENKRLIKEKVDEQKADYEAQLLKAQAQQDKLQREREQAMITSINESKPDVITIPSFNVPKDLILMTAKKISNATFIIGEGGIGKTFLTINAVKELGLQYEKDYIYRNSFTTPLSLFITLHDHRDKLIILDDVEGLLEDQKALAILRSALWESIPNKRIVTYLSTTKIMEDYEPQFEFTGQVILLANKVNTRDVHTQAFISRTNYYELRFSFAEKKALFMHISSKPYKELTLESRQFVLNKLLDKISIATRELNFRTLIKAYDYYIYDKEKLDLLLDETLQVDDELNLIVKLMNEGKPLTEQLKEWYDITGKCRASYFKKKKKVYESTQSKVSKKTEMEAIK